VELRLRNYQQVLQKLDRRRGLTDFGGAVLMTLFFNSHSFWRSELHEIFN
jgi:hypothetical protein